VRTLPRRHNDAGDFLIATFPPVGRPWQNHRVTNDEIIEVFRRAAGDRTHGAAEIEESLISAVLALRASWTPKQLATGARLLAEGQPAMAPLARLEQRLGTDDLDGLRSSLEERLSALRLAPEILVANAASWIDRAVRVVSISRSSAVAAAVEGAWRKGWTGNAVVLDGSSAGCGWQQTERLTRHGRALSQPDASAPRWLDLPGTLVAVGADAVAPRRFINCIGTMMLLELAVAREVPTILIADRGKDVSDEMLAGIVERLPHHREGPVREWPLFEDIPLALVTARISD